MTAKQAEYIYSKCKYGGIIGTEQAYKHKWNNKERNRFYIKSLLMYYTNVFELYSVHAESAEIEKWSVLHTEVDCIEYRRKALPTNIVKFNPTKGRCQKGYK